MTEDRITANEIQDAVDVIIGNLDLLSGEDIDDLFLAVAIEARKRQEAAGGDFRVGV